VKLKLNLELAERDLDVIAAFAPILAHYLRERVPADPRDIDDVTEVYDDMPPPDATDTPDATDATGFGEERFARGKEVFNEMVCQWSVNLDDPTKEQPDRAELIRALANGSDVANVLAHVGRCRGMLHAIDAALREEYPYFNAAGDTGEASLRALVTKIGIAMCQVSSIFFPELSDHYEHRDIYKGKQ
jgi:hypothetical protein